ncbi:MAG: PEGA domain-containing protein [Lachnospiraceae bacterium]|nr:PEGA domain-containing protein [Lachnospiraceae bacterium]MEE1341491.1 PEGA domain-containing protein [Lachnospiraceae bacterium]
MKKIQKILLFLICAVFLVCFTACDQAEEATEEKLEASLEDGQVLATIKEIDTTVGCISLVEVSSGKTMIFSYQSGLNIMDKYGKVIALSQVQVGDIVHVTYDSNNKKLQSLQLSKEAWKVEGLTKLKIDKAKETITVLGESYKYTDALVVGKDNEAIDLIEICDSDQVSVSGYKGKVCSIQVELGHGYVRLTNYDTYIGGMLEIGREVILPVTKDMLIAVREGSYRLQIDKNGYVGSKNIVVKEDEEIVVSLAELQIPAKRMGKVAFDVTPQEAIVTVDGKVVDITKELELEYGEHTLSAECEGYISYSGTLSITDAYIICTIQLPSEDSNETQGTVSTQQQTNEENETTTTTTTEATSSETTTESTKDSTNTVVKTVTIASPIGVKVYCDSQYVGTAPVTFTKNVGSHIITLSKSGYKTKSYTIEIVDGKEELSFCLPELVK